MAESNVVSLKKRGAPPPAIPVTDDVNSNSALPADQALEDSLNELRGDLIYSINESPTWYASILLGFQHYLTMFGSTLGIPLLLTIDLCMADTPVDIGKLIQTEFFVSGLATFFQSTFGTRLPIVQGASLAFLGPAQAILRADGPCPPALSPENRTDEAIAMREEFWRERMNLLQGAILVACLVEVIIGFTGLIGLLLRFIGPLTIAPTVALIGLSLFNTAAFFSGGNWLLAGCVIVLISLFSQYLNRIVIPIPGFSADRRVIRFPIFKLLPVILAIIFAWTLAAILTVTDVIPEGSPGRTDARANILRDSPWFYIPYPFQWGVPVVTVAGVLGMIAGVLASTIESIGDYYACARVSGAPPPPNHAVNRGIGMEGFGCILAGLWGTGLGTTSYTQNIGVINITKVGSRRVVQLGAVIMILLGSLGKFGAFFATIPIPIVGGMFCVLFGLVTAVGLSTLQHVDLNSSRNLFVLGVPLFMGLVLPAYMTANEGVINTRSPEFNQIVTVLLSTNMFVGGVLAAILDNTIPGTNEERGLLSFRQSYSSPELAERHLRCYDLPFGMKWIRSVRFFEYLPFSPTFQGFLRRRNKPSRNGDIPNGQTNNAMDLNGDEAE